MRKICSPPQSNVKILTGDEAVKRFVYEGKPLHPFCLDFPQASHMGVAYYMAVTDFIVLFPDGYALGALPAQGMDGFSRQAYMQQMGRTPNAIARYQMFPDHLEPAYSNFSRSYVLPGAGGPGSLAPQPLQWHDVWTRLRLRQSHGAIQPGRQLRRSQRPGQCHVEVVWRPRLTQG